MLFKVIKKWLIKHQSEAPKGNSLRRLMVLASMISALIRSGRASLQSIGDEMESEADLESRIKQAKRWLNSKWTDVESHFIPYIVPILRSLSTKGQLLLAIDGSCVGKDCMALMVSVIWRKRAIPIAWLVRKAPKGHFPEQMHIELINEVIQILKQVIPNSCQIVLLGDGEFCGADLQQTCLAHEWDYALKTAKDTLIADNPEMNHHSKMGDLATIEPDKHLILNDMYITKKAFGPVNLLYWHDPKHDEPIYLLSNLDYAPDIIKYYNERFCIETFFGDIKSRGFNIHRTKIDKPETLYNLLIVACLAFIISILFEFEARKSTHLPKFCRKERVDDLSVFQLGYRGLKYYIKKRFKINFQFSKNFP